MANGKLVAGFEVVSGANAVVLTHASSEYTITVATGTTYYWSFDDATATTGYDFAKYLSDAIVAEIGGGLTLSFSQVGTNATSSTLGDGRMYGTTSSGTVSWKFSDSAFTFPKNLLGFDAADTTDRNGAYDGLSIVPTNYVLDASWFPRCPAVDDYAVRRQHITTAETSVRGHTDRVYWAAYDMLDLIWELLPAVLVGKRYSVDSLRASALLLSTSDPYASYEGFIEHCLENNSPIRYYPDATDASYLGPYRIQGDSPLERGGMALTEQPIPAQDAWNVRFAAQSVPA